MWIRTSYLADVKAVEIIHSYMTLWAHFKLLRLCALGKCEKALDSTNSPEKQVEYTVCRDLN
jgi:hypothetical protein